MAAPLHRFDIFCRVVDNFGDAGVAFRLARQLAVEHGLQVTLYIDDPSVLARIVPGPPDPKALAGVEMRPLPDALSPSRLPDAVLEAFGCGLPERYLDAMQASASPPVWVNLEYLSAESWVEGTHGLPSPHPQRPLRRWFFFPGFTPGTGGLIRERDLFARRDAHRSDPVSHATLWTSLSLSALPVNGLTVSLFCYPNAALAALLARWADDDAPIACIVPEGIAGAALEALFRGTPPRAGEVRRAGALTLVVAPFVDQDAFERRLWTCALNFVRGEDSFVRAQWAARPLVWHIYPQEARAHIAKLDAFLDRYTARLEPPASMALRRFWHAFNGQSGEAVAEAWGPLRDSLPELSRHAAHWAQALAGQRDLASGLVAFVEDRAVNRL